MGKAPYYIRAVGMISILCGVAACNYTAPAPVSVVVVEKHTEQYICTIKPLTMCPSWYITVESGTDRKVVRTDERQYNRVKPGQHITLQGDRIVD